VNYRNKDKHLFSYINLADTYEAQDMYDRAIDIYEEYIRNIDDNITIRRLLALLYIDYGKLDLAWSEAEKAAAHNPEDPYIFRLFGDLHFYGNFMEAEKEYRKLLETKSEHFHRPGAGRLATLYLTQGRFQDAIEQLKYRIEVAHERGEMTWAAWAHMYMSYIYWKSGDLERAKEHNEMCWQIAVDEESVFYQRMALLSKGLIYTAVGKMDEAVGAADELKASIQKSMNTKLMRLYYYLMGQIEIKRQNYSAAIECAEKALSLLSYGPLTWRADFRDALSRAYYESGELEKARENYKKITLLTSGRAWCGDIYAKAFYMLGKIYEEQGDAADASENYEKFLDLWKDADPGIAEVEDAKKRLASLRK